MDIVELLLGAMMAWAGGNAIIAAIRLRREYLLFPNAMLYPANCKPEHCTDVGGFIDYMVPRLWMFGAACLLIALSKFYTAFVRLEEAWVTYAVLAAALAVIGWYMVLLNRAAKKFW